MLSKWVRICRKSFIAKERARLKEQYIQEEKRRQMWKDIGIAFLITSAVALIIGVFGFVFVQTTEVAYYVID